MRLFLVYEIIEEPRSKLRGIRSLLRFNFFSKAVCCQGKDSTQDFKKRHVALEYPSAAILSAHTHILWSKSLDSRLPFPYIQAVKI